MSIRGPAREINYAADRWLRVALRSWQLNSHSISGKPVVNIWFNANKAGR